MQFTDILLHWYEENKRSLPWRGERDVYRVWVSEIILQQTRVVQGWDYYLRFVEAFPNVRSLAAADEATVLRLWQGLGYYSRARNMHAAAQQIMERHHGQFPKTYDEIRALKGIGDYTAAAICAFAYQQPYPAIDGNALRVICRIFGITENIMAESTKKQVKELCQKLIKDCNPAEFNQAMMDFGSLQCVPKNPDCRNCPLASECYAQKHNSVDLLPVSIKNIKIKKRYFHYFLLIQNDKILIEKRGKNDIWANLYQLPMLETDNSKLLDFKVLYKKKHQLTHQSLEAVFYEIGDEESLPKSELERRWIPFKKIKEYAFPTLVVKFLEEEIETIE